MADVVPIMTAFFGGLALLAGAFFKYMATREKAAAMERKQQSEVFVAALDKLGKHIDKSAEVQERSIVEAKLGREAQQKAAQEAENRNGHLAELSIENKKSNAEQYSVIIKAISDMKEQHVGLQHVDKQTVVTETVKHKE